MGQIGDKTGICDLGFGVWVFGVSKIPSIGALDVRSDDLLRITYVSRWRSDGGTKEWGVCVCVPRVVAKKRI